MGLKELSETGDIRPLVTNAIEIRGLLDTVERRLRDAKSKQIFSETRLEQAYEAIFSCATAALRAGGYRAKSGEGSHIITIETLRQTIFKGQDDWGLVDYCHNLREKRHNKMYHALKDVPESQVNEAIENAESLLLKTMEWLRRNHPELSPMK